MKQAEGAIYLFGRQGQFSCHARGAVCVIIKKNTVILIVMPDWIPAKDGIESGMTKRQLHFGQLRHTLGDGYPVNLTGRIWISDCAGMTIV